MTQLTQEAFEATLGKLATKDDLRELATKDDLRELATKDDLQDLETKMKAYTDDQTDELGRMINTSFQKHRDDYLEEKFERLTDTHNLQVELRSLAQRVEQLEKRRS